MKKGSLLLLTAVTLGSFFTHVASAQSSDSDDKLKLGIKAGLNVAYINDDDRVPSEYISSRMGFHVGVLAHYHLSDKWALQPELIYSKEGAEYDWPGNSSIGRYQGKTDLNLLKFPILAQYMFGPSFRIQTGPQVGLIVNANFEDKNNDEVRKLDIQRVDIAWAFGLGYLHNSGFGLDGRFNWGLTNIYPSGTYPGQGAYMRTWQFGVFYQFK
ncbi:hypothetical protein TH63_07185 [Rufibacter radiotolerans]|uniref:Outer membrane protein beta-barrel domain-containing protein n=1 Tax=Rufibacter radiotolerans TaxID=1379910 RepID=A0A0H4VP22_9BACT|nr:porin family protein [Rufibacter radiotolerans]AKQ45474.1 hypothetical protein TH63_07185 [Rufibacter radiotolerans]